METTIRKVLVPRFGDESILQVIEATNREVQVLHSVVAGSDVNMRRGA
jgi:synaptic vesicle membrane protein VAT-1